jgi:2-phospho-L-lactate guanylyltransferase
LTTWVVIPAKTTSTAKGRLAGALSAYDRNRLAARMLRTAIDAASEAVGAGRVAIVGWAPADIDAAILVIAEPSGGLNAALDHARQVLAAEGATRIVSLAADLPQVIAADVLALTELPPSCAGIAPDRHGTGTNALSLPLPAAMNFAYHYGPGSCERHLAEAARIGLAMRRIERGALARDIDEPADLDDARGLFLRQHG